MKNAIKTFHINIGSMEDIVVTAKYMTVDINGNLIFYNKTTRKLKHTFKEGFWISANEYTKDQPS